MVQCSGMGCRSVLVVVALVVLGRVPALGLSPVVLVLLSSGTVSRYGP